MPVVATAGHVDHGKSTLVRALTGTEPDRWAEERRRGLTIDLGYAWTTLPSGAHLAFVDVPGHQRFVANMLAGLGPAPAVLFVVAADGGWSRQSEEHLAAADALAVRHGLLAVTRSDLADPAPALADARERLASTTLGDVEALTVSGRTGDGLPDLVAALDRLAAALPAPDDDAPVRLWLDRSFSVKGAGTVVTGTLAAGTIAVDDQLEIGGRLVTVRGIQSAESERQRVTGVARVALNLRGTHPDEVGRGDALLTPDRFLATDRFDVRLAPREDIPRELVLHAGTAAVPVRVRRLDETHARLTLARPLPLRAGDRAVLRDPGLQTVAAGALVLDADPPSLRRRGAAAERAVALAAATGTPRLDDEVARRGAVRADHLVRLGITGTPGPPVREHDGWLVSADRWPGWLAERGLVETGGRVGRPAAAPAVPGLDMLLARLAANPFDAPERDELAALGLGPRALMAAHKAGSLLRLAPELVVGADAPARAVARLRAIEQPFTLSAARQALGTTRRVAVPLLELLDDRGLTERVDGTHRTVTS
ncbi:SelB domain-containing protein [Jatrophihabitans fulvus]